MKLSIYTGRLCVENCDGVIWLTRADATELLRELPDWIDRIPPDGVTRPEYPTVESCLFGAAFDLKQRAYNKAMELVA